MTEMSNDVFDHDHGAIDNHPKIQCAEREQVGGDTFELEAVGGEQKRKRDGQGNDGGAANIAEEEEKDDHDKEDALGEIVEDGVGGVVKEVVAVEKRNHFNAGRQDVVVELVDLDVNGVKGGLGISAFAQEDDARTDVVVIDDHTVFAMNGAAKLAKADLGALSDHRDVLNPQGGARLGNQGGVLDVGDISDQADGTNVDLLQARFDETAPGVGVVVGELLFDLRQAEAVGNQLVRIDADLVFASRPAKTGAVANIGHRLTVLFDDPVFDGLQIHHVIYGIRALQGEEIDLPDGATIRSHLRVDALGQGDLGEPLEHALSIPGILLFIVENEFQIGKAEERKRTEVGDVGNTIHNGFEGDGHLLLDLLGGDARPLRDDLDIVVGNIGIGFDGKLVEGESTPKNQENGNGEDNEAIVEREIDNTANHGFS